MKWQNRSRIASVVVMKLAVFASKWGTFPRFGRKTRAWLEGVRDAGFAGVECSLSDLGRDRLERSATCEAISAHGLRLILGLYSGWVDYEGCPAPSTPEAHLELLEKQFGEASDLGGGAPIAHVNVHAGCDSWAEDVAGAFLSRSLGLGAQFLEARPQVGAGSRVTDAHGGTPAHLHGVSYETHRGRCLFSPFATMRYLEYIEPLRLTADLSHWHVVSERLLDDEATAARLRGDVAPFVDHVHARVGGPNQIQLNAEARYWTPRAHIPPFGDETPEKLAAVDAHERLWTAVWEHKLARGAAEVLATPEYGPPPYQLGAPSKKVVTNRGLWLQTLDAKAHLESVFETVVANNPKKTTAAPN